MPAIPWQIVLLHPLGLTLTFLSTFLFIFLWMLMAKTPAMTFFKAGFGKKMILISPDKDKRIIFRIARKDTDMAYVKKWGYYIIDPKHVYIESSSKLPCAITYGSFGESIDSEGAEMAEKMFDVGVRNYVDLMGKYYEEKTAGELLKDKVISRDEYDKAPNKVYTVRKKKSPDDLKIFGKSVKFDNIINYFSKNTRADLIESKIQHRISAIKMEKLAGGANAIKWAVILVIILIGGALAYNMIAMSQPPPAVAVQPSAATSVGGYVSGGVDAITGGG